MARCTIDEVENYSNGNGGFFSLKDDGDTAHIRFMYNDINDVVFDVIHEVEIDGKTRYINCLRTHDEAVENCPLCEAGYKQLPKLFMPIYNEDTKETQIWQRGRNFRSQLSGLCARYSPLIGTPVEVERHGKKGDTSTTYQIFPEKTDNCTLDDLPEALNPLGTIILDKTYDELCDYVDTGRFKSDDAKPVERTREPANREEVTPRRATAPAPRRKF